MPEQQKPIPALKSLLIPKSTIKKFSNIWFAVSVVLLLSNCGRLSNNVWVKYEETYCLDPWGQSDLDQSEKISSIEDYLASEDIRVYDVQIYRGNHPELCLACNCHSGRIVRVNINENDMDKAEDLGFYPSSN